MNNFTFITATQAPEEASQAPAVRTLVRRQALRAYYSSQGSDLTPQRQRESNAVGTSRRQHMHRFRLPKDRQGKNASRDQPVRSRRSQSPGRNIPLLEVKAVELLEYFRASTAMPLKLKSMIINQQEEWFQFALNNTSLSQATLCLVSLSRDQMARQRTSAITLRYRAEAIKLLQREIQSDLVSRDIMAGTIALLAITEDLEGNHDNSEMHIVGLVQIVGTKGGVGSFTTSNALRRIVSWADVYHSSAWRVVRPRLIRASQVLARQELEHAAQVSRFREGLAQVLCAHIRGVVELMRGLPDRTNDPVVASETQRVIVKHIAEAFRRRIALRYEQVSPLGTSFVIAIMLYLYGNCSQWTKFVPIIAGLLSDLAMELGKIDMNSLRTNLRHIANSVLLWIYAIGFFLSTRIGSVDSAIFSSGFVTFMQALGITPLNVCDHLALIAWSENFDQELLMLSTLCTG